MSAGGSQEEDLVTAEQAREHFGLKAIGTKILQSLIAVVMIVLTYSIKRKIESADRLTYVNLIIYASLLFFSFLLVSCLPSIKKSFISGLGFGIGSGMIIK